MTSEREGTAARRTADLAALTAAEEAAGLDSSPERVAEALRIVREFDRESLPRVTFSTKVSRNARVTNRMFRYPRGLVVNRQGRVLAMWERLTPPSRTVRLRPVPVKRSRRSR